MTDKIITHEDWQRLPWVDFVAFYSRQHGGSGKLPPVTEKQGIVAAYINLGRWIAECPDGDGCAMVVTPAHPYFMCVVCGNEKNSGRWYGVKFPTQAEKKTIEAALLKRPIKNRNWEPGETVKTLEAENLMHGVG